MLEAWNFTKNKLQTNKYFLEQQRTNTFDICFKINESPYIALFVVSGSIKKLFSIDYVNIYLFSIFFFQ